MIKIEHNKFDNINAKSITEDLFLLKKELSSLEEKLDREKDEIIKLKNLKKNIIDNKSVDDIFSKNNVSLSFENLLELKNEIKKKKLEINKSNNKLNSLNKLYNYNKEKKKVASSVEKTILTAKNNENIVARGMWYIMDWVWKNL